MPARANKIENYYQAKHSPSKDPNTLDLWWGIEMSLSYYSPFLVRFVKRVSQSRGATKKDVLSFSFVRDVNELLKPLGNFIVDLKDEPREVWPLPPSTIPSQEDLGALQAGEALYGFLFLSREWENAAQDVIDKRGIPLLLRDLTEGGGKWPIAAIQEEEEYIQLQALIERLSDAKKRNRLQASLNKAFNK